MLRHVRRSCTVAIAALTCGSLMGCSPALGLQDWQRDILAALAGGVGSFVAGQSTRVIVERQCFENGVEVDCSTIPGA